MVGCMPRKDSGVVRNVGAGFVMAQQPAELTTMTPSHPYAGRNTTTTTPAAASPLGVPRTPSPNRAVRAAAPSPSPEGPRGRRRARSPSPSPERSKRVKTEGATPSSAAPNAAAAIPPPPPSTSSPSVYLRPASESTPPATFSFVAAPPAAQPQPQPKPAASPAAPVKPKPKSAFSALLDEASNAPPPEKPRAFPDGNIPGFQKPVRMNEAPVRSSAPFELLPSRIPGLGQLAAAVAAAPTTPSPAALPPPPSSPPKDKEVDCARPLQVNPADFFPQAALPACLTPPQQQQQPAVCSPLPQPQQQQPLFRRPSTPPPPPPQPVQQHHLFSALPQQQQQSVLRPLQQQRPQQQIVFPSFWELQQQRAARSPSPSDDEDEDIADAPPLANVFARLQPPQDDEELCDAPSVEEPSADADVVIEDAPADAEAPFSVDAGELLDADSEKDDEDLPDAEPTQGPNVDYEQLPDAAPDANPDVNVDVNTLAPPTSPKVQTLANLSPCSLTQIRGHFLKKSRSNPNRMGSPKPTSPTGPKTPTTPIRPLSPTSPTDSATRPLSPDTSSNRSRSPTSEPAARSARTRRGTAHRNGKQRAAQAKRREKREEYETSERLRTEKEEENERRIAVLEAENARLKTDQARSSEQIAALEGQLAEANDLATSAAKARDEAQSNADELNKKLTREVAADEATKQALANVNAELDSANDTIKVLKSDMDQLDEHIICMESDHAFEIDSRDSLAEEWEKNLNQLEQRAQTAEAALESARLYINNEATSSDVLQQEFDGTKSELEQEKLKAKDLQTELDQQQTELDQQKSKSESLTRNFRFLLDTQTAKVMKLTDANAKLTADNSQLQQNVDTEVARSRQLEQRHEELRSHNLKLQKDLKNNAGRTRMPTQQEAGPSNFSYGWAQRELNSTKTTRSNITTELSGASDEMELEMSTAARANRSKDITIKKLTAQLADFEARYDALKAVLADYEAAPTPSSPLPAAFSSGALSIMPSSEAPELDSEDASESLQLTSAQPSSSAAPSTESSPKPTESTGTQTDVVCSVKLAKVNQSSSGALTTVSSPEPTESTLVTALVQPSSSTALPTKTAQEMLREFEELLLKGRDEVNSRADRIDGGIDALEASMKRSRTPACISCIGKSVSSMSRQPLLFLFMLLLFFFLLTSVAIGHSMQEELWHEANTLSQDVSFSPARTQIAGYGQVAVLVLFIINRWRS